ncbi:hypothetical protein DMB66_50105 [Actinoplanes sp. ATCC 53533]|nr:hypothetical protein DMB66_50105 [Actinoplanes sp. ATCC 53533]
MTTESGGSGRDAHGTAGSAPAGGGQTLLVLGASGDLTARLLLPGLGGLLAGGPDEGLFLVGSGSDAWDDERWRRRVSDSFLSASATGAQVTATVNSARYLPPHSPGRIRRRGPQRYSGRHAASVHGCPNRCVRVQMAGRRRRLTFSEGGIGFSRGCP